MILQHFSYADFKTSFYQRVKDKNLFEVSGINFVKVIMESLVVRYGIKGKIRAYIFYPFPIAFINLKRILLSRKKIAEKFFEFERNYNGKPAEIILVDSGRTLLDRNGESISTYFHNVRNFLKEKNIKFLHYYERQDKVLYPDDFSDTQFKEIIKYRKVTQFDKELIKELKTLLKNTQNSGYFNESEIISIKSGLTVFFESARVWNFYITHFRPKKIFLLGHYHREGIIYACKKNKVEVVELQHGLIAEEDIFYVLPEFFKEIKDKSLFADKILTYGTYWNDILKKGHEYSSEQVKTLGYYLYEDKMGSEKEEALLKTFTENRKAVLITTQPALHADFCDYLTIWLNNNPENFRFIIKLHPADVESWYDVFKSNPNVLITRIRLEVLFRYATTHVTSYSTTIYDAMRYGIESYSVNFPSSADYVKKITEEGFSTLLQTNQYPELSKSMTGKGSLPFEKFFQKPDLNILLS